MTEVFSASAQAHLREMVSEPLWYKEFSSYQRRVRIGAAAVSAMRGYGLKTRQHEVQHQMYSVFEELLGEDKVALGQEGYNWDSERLPVDRIVLHHTGNKPGIRPSFLDAMHLLKLYVPAYVKPAPSDVERVTGNPIHSGHFDAGGRQVFRAYHWLVGENRRERLLPDDQTGWHAGNWNVNCRSVAICVDSDLSEYAPSPEIVEGIVEVISEHYPNITPSPETIIGHNEVYRRTICPGPQFAGWKDIILKSLS